MPINQMGFSTGFQIWRPLVDGTALLPGPVASCFRSQAEQPLRQKIILEITKAIETSSEKAALQA